MKRLVLSASVATALLAAGVAANAANAPTTGSNTAPMSADANASSAPADLQGANLRQHLQDQLSKAGYSAVKITPTSFFIQAKDKKGDPVAMIIGPDSFTVVTDVLQKPSSATAEQTASKTSPAPTQK